MLGPGGGFPAGWSGVQNLLGQGDPGRAGGSGPVAMGLSNDGSGLVGGGYGPLDGGYLYPGPGGPGGPAYSQLGGHGGGLDSGYGPIKVLPAAPHLF